MAHDHRSQSFNDARTRQEKVGAFFLDILGLQYEGSSGYFAPIKVNDRLALDFNQDDSLEPHQYAVQWTSTCRE